MPDTAATIAEHRLHDTDTGSPEVQVALLSGRIDHLTEHGVIEARRFYESPFTDLSPTGPDALFESDDVDRMLQVVTDIRHNAEVA